MAGAKKTHADELETHVDYSWGLMYPYALRAAVLLKVPTIIQAAGPEAALSAKEICTHLPNPERASAEALEKILEVLTCHDIFTSTVEVTEAGRVKKYALASQAQDLAGEDSLAAEWLMFFTAPEIAKMWLHMHESVLNPELSVFERQYGKGIFQYLKEDVPEFGQFQVGIMKIFLYLKEDVPEFGQFQVGIMKKISVKHTGAVLEYYDEEFQSFTGTLVDVGGSQGDTAAIFASKYPNIKSVVNFDLPDFVSKASAYRGVEHVGGSFLDFVPEGDMLFLKFVLLNWNDEQLAKLFRNCFSALPAKGGKMIIVDKVRPDEGQDEKPNGVQEKKVAKVRLASQNLLTSLAFKGAKLRTLREHQVLAKASGFASFRIAKTIDTLSFMEAEKAPAASLYGD